MREKVIEIEIIMLNDFIEFHIQKSMITYSSNINILTILSL